MEFYALKTAACWAILYGFYKLVLERESMHHLKRWYLLGGLALGAIIPLITFTSYVLVDGEAVIYMVRGEEGAALGQQSFWQSLDYSKILWTVYWVGFGLFAIRFLWNLSKLIRSILAHPKSAKRPLFFVLLGRPVQPHTCCQQKTLYCPSHPRRSAPARASACRATAQCRRIAGGTHASGLLVQSSGLFDQTQHFSQSRILGGSGRFKDRRPQESISKYFTGLFESSDLSGAGQCH
nr:hypothetical protein [Gilvibacter sp.]